MPSAARAALQAAFAKQYGHYKLHPTLVQAKLVDYFDGRGESVVDVRFDVDRDDQPAWEQGWLERAEDAGVDGNADRKDLVRWLLARSAPITAGSAASGATALALTTLEAHGTIVAPDAAAALAVALAAGDAGDELMQSTCPLCVAYLYFGRAFDADEAAWYEQQRAAVAGRDGVTIDVRELKAYRKRHEGTTATSLEHGQVGSALAE